jgi:hypothetical protein
MLVRGALAAVVGLAALPAGAAAQSGFSCAGDLGTLPVPKATSAKLQFGIYPGGPAGVIAGPRPPTVPEVQPKIDERLAQLRRGRPFVAHLYAQYSGAATPADAVDAIQRQARTYTRQGLLYEVVLTYRPPAYDVAGYTAFVRRVVARLAPDRRVKAIQVTNEVNQTAAPDASDGAYEGARDALVQGVIAAKEEALARGRADLGIGFNWFYRMDPGTEDSFWSELARKGGARFARSVDWVGLDAYPGTYFPPGPLRRREAMVNAFSTLRCLAKVAGIRSSTPIHVTENGYPTDPSRTYEEQRNALREFVQTTHDYRRNYNVTDYRWFDLRDADSSSPRFEQQFGLTRSDYTPKPAFGAYRDLISSLGRGPEAAPALRLCATAPGRVRGRSLGGVRLGAKRAAVRKRFPSYRGSRRFDRFCLTGGGSLRVGYRAGRAALVLSSSPRTSVLGRRPGSRRVRVPRTRRVRVGRDRFLIRRGVIVRVRRRRVVSVGIASRPRVRNLVTARRFLGRFR